MGNKPIHKMQYGALSAAIWENSITGKDGLEKAMYSVTLDRNYQDSSGNWKNTKGYRVSDLPTAAMLLTDAYRYIQENYFGRNGSEE